MQAHSQEILDLEKRYWTAMRESDFDTLVELTDFPCVVAGAQGARTFDQATFKKMFESGQSKIKDFKFDEGSVEVRQVSPETAVIAYKITSTFQHDGQDKTVDAVDASTWVKRNGQWVCAMHAETELPK